MLHNRLRAVSAAGNRGGVPTDGLIAHYTMDNVSGSTLIDEAGNFNGSISGATQVTGVMGQALSFDGTDKVTGVGYVTGTTDLTVGIWFNTTQTGSTGIIYSQEVGLSYRAVFLAAGGIAVFSRDAAGNYQQTPLITGYQDGLWHYLVFSEIGVELSLIIDDTSTSTLTMPSKNSVRESDPDGHFGETPLSALHFVGKLDIARIYNRALSAEEKTSLYNEV